MALNYAEVWRPELIEIYRQQGLYVPFMTDNVKWLSAKTFHLTRMTTSGYKNHARTIGWNVGTIAQNDNQYTLTHDRDISFPVDKLDVDETNATASIQNVAKVFTQTQKAPEGNALFFSKIATAAVASSLYDSTALSTWTTANVYTRLKAILKKGNLRYYLSKGALIMYLSSDIMDLLEQSTSFTRKIEMVSLTEDGLGLNTRITSIDGAYLIEVMDSTIFYDKFDFTEGFLPVENGIGVTGSHKINVLVASPLTTWFVPKIDSIYYYAPGTDSSVGDCYKYCDRSLCDCFILPNGDTNAVDSVYVSLDTSEYGLEGDVVNYPAPIYNYPVGDDTFPVPTGTFAFVMSPSTATGIEYEINVAGEIPLISSVTKTGLGYNGAVTNIFTALIKIPFTGTFDLTKVKYSSGVDTATSAVEATAVYTIGSDKYLINCFGVYDVGSGVIANYKASAADRNIINIEYDEEVITYKYTYTGATLEA